MRTLILLALSAALLSAQPRPDHVVIIGVDGLSPDGILMALTPQLDEFRKSGAWSFRARGVMPTVSSPNWASMIMGAGPEQHGITSNAWEVDTFEFTPQCTGLDGRFPTIFGILRQQRPDSRIGVFHEWGGFGRLVEPSAPSHRFHDKDPKRVTAEAVSWWKANRPALLFVHLDLVDHAGHDHGWLSREYYEAVAAADGFIREIVQGVRGAAPDARTVFLVSSDHGGVGKKHGGMTMTELEIPWIAWGSGVASGREIEAPINTFDTAATAAWLLGLDMPACWIGRPVAGAFVR
ncbi:MAG: alkaline phosphatase [Bryobacterales bacterium]|nr:alkaline phosphatase [Bryobacterales bacterium]